MSSLVKTYSTGTNRGCCCSPTAGPTSIPRYSPATTRPHSSRGDSVTGRNRARIHSSDRSGTRFNRPRFSRGETDSTGPETSSRHTAASEHPLRPLHLARSFPLAQNCRACLVLLVESDCISASRPGRRRLHSSTLAGPCHRISRTCRPFTGTNNPRWSFTGTKEPCWSFTGTRNPWWSLTGVQRLPYHPSGPCLCRGVPVWLVVSMKTRIGP